MILSVLSALAEPTRLGVITLLADGSEHCVCELMKTLGATQSRMSRHMQVLRHAGLVVDRRDAQWVRYRLNPQMPPETHAVLKAVLAADAAARDERNVA
ncbi:ArsR/SmtB family transcription factor [Rhodobacter maris]|uniref:ArsR family transcriptional regulator n=1 Tax=Rhodobacter maris TaxID=446682 RepID=A0A285TH28_9RHOB|nr:metalloregulator ArsR/SmtB family transcription factor [Rhodobacter maris]SOC19706.1 ArsR family transcriptional regulator [Rhodobacter maris]